uniref:Putative secreted protein n=1 Tax=Amblyomma triste TaxID=251400 RepID=A0A023G5J1_AMBTT
MELFRVLLIILSGAATSVKCCKKNEKAFRCGTMKLVIEEVCQDVQRASCTPYTILCKCADDMYRSTRGDCVPRSECLTAEQVEEEQIRQQNERNERLFESAVSVVENHHPIHLLRISTETWINSLCICMKSTFMASHLNSADRTVECYYHPSDKTLSHITMKTMQVVVFTVVNDNGRVKIRLRPESGGQLLFDLQNEYLVLGAESTCIVLKTGMDSRGKFS